MRTTAMILALTWLTPRVDKLWSAPLHDETVLGKVLKNCQRSGIIDEICIVTNAPSLVERRAELDARIFECPDFYVEHAFNFLNIEQHNLYRELDLSHAAAIHGDLTFQLSWNTPLLGARTLEAMYHKLLDDQSTARVIPMYPVDPHLYTKLPGTEDFLPVWEHKGFDRQKSLQLFRPTTVCLTNWARLLSTIPKVVGLSLDSVSCFTLDSEEQLALVRHLHAYQQRSESYPA
jgi:hypothetical protein